MSTGNLPSYHTHVTPSWEGSCETPLNWNHLPSKQKGKGNQASYQRAIGQQELYQIYQHWAQCSWVWTPGPCKATSLPTCGASWAAPTSPPPTFSCAQSNNARQGLWETLGLLTGFALPERSPLPKPLSFSSASKFAKQGTGKCLSVHGVQGVETRYQKNEANDLKKENIDSSVFLWFFKDSVLLRKFSKCFIQIRIT